MIMADHHHHHHHHHVQSNSQQQNIELSHCLTVPSRPSNDSLNRWRLILLISRARQKFLVFSPNIHDIAKIYPSSISLTNINPNSSATTSSSITTIDIDEQLETRLLDSDDNVNNQVALQIIDIVHVMNPVGGGVTSSDIDESPSYSTSPKTHAAAAQHSGTITNEQMSNIIEGINSNNDEDDDGLMPSTSSTTTGIFNLLETLSSIVKEKNFASLCELGGVEAIAVALNTNLETGIICTAAATTTTTTTTTDVADHDAQDHELRRRRYAYGTNTYMDQQHIPLKKRYFFDFVFKACKDWTIFLLFCCASLSLGSGIKEEGLKNGWYDGTMIFIGVFILVAATSVIEFFRSKRRSQNKLMNLQNTQVINVLRLGCPQLISISDVVVGDIVCLDIGDQIPADGLFTKEGIDNLKVADHDDVSRLIDRAYPFLCCGATVIEGSAQMLVTSVGMNMEWGKMMSTVLNHDSRKHTLLPDRLNKQNTYVQNIALFIAMLILKVLLLRYLLGKKDDETGYPDQMSKRTAVSELMKSVEKLLTKPRGIISFTTMLGVLLVGIQHGLSLIITLSLSYWSKKMMNCHVIIRELCGCVTASSITIICTDKTGGLTMNQMTVNDFRRAGVSTRLISSDSLPVARAIAIECGILGPDQDLHPMVLEAEEFRNYTEEERKEKVDHIIVMGNSLPSDKLLFLQFLRRNGHVVAVTGGRTIDTPTLIEADVGFLIMSKENSEMAKESSDIVLLDGNLDSMITVLWFGRCAYQNIRKFIQFELTINASGLLITFVTTVTLGDSPIAPLQLFLVNLIVGALASFALLIEPPTKELLETPPVDQTKPLITKAMWRNIITQVSYQVGVLLIFQFKGQALPGVNTTHIKAMIFNGFVLCQILNQFIAREPEKKNVFKGIIILNGINYWFLLSVGFPIVLQVIVMEFATTTSLVASGTAIRLSWVEWFACILFAITSWLIDFLVKCISSFFIIRRSTAGSPWLAATHQVDQY